ncbi:MAG: TIGR00159 family protein [Chloroflexi bacterium]|nr:TIGR00159 family protein [Chloroflexota bacterium]
MQQLLASILDQVRPTTLLDIGITALLVYWLFSLIRGTRAVRLVIGVSVLFVVYFAAQALTLRLLTQILQAGAVVGLFALVVVFQPELRRALERIGRVGSFAWLFPGENTVAVHVSADVARAASLLSGEGHGALIVLERDTGLEEIAETGVMIHGDLSVDLLSTIFMPRSALHDGAVIVRGATILAAGALLPLTETTVHTERFGTRHRAALGITEQTDAVVVVVSEENGQVSLVERARIVRNLNELQLARAIRELLDPAADGTRRRIRGRTGSRAPTLADLGQLVRRSNRRTQAAPEALASAAPAVPAPPPGSSAVAAAGEPVPATEADVAPDADAADEVGGTPRADAAALARGGADAMSGTPDAAHAAPVGDLRGPAARKAG